MHCLIAEHVRTETKATLCKYAAVSKRLVFWQ